MPRFNVSVAIRVWVDREIVAPTEEEAREKIKAKAKRLLNSDGFGWADGKVEILGSLNSSLLNKIPS